MNWYIGLTSAVRAKAHDRKLKAGRIVILPSPFGGSLRNMMQIYQYVITILLKFGKPDNVYLAEPGKRFS